ANDLVRQGWAVVTPAGEHGARLEALVQALVRARAEDQRADVLSIRVPPGMDAAAATAWKKDVYPTLYGEDEARRPRYLLILGDLDQVSLETQQVLAQDGFPGRLACANDDGYAAYADKVLAWQRRPPAHDRARALFYTVHDGTSATTAGHAKLIQPCHDRCARAARDNARAFPASTVEAHGAQLPDPDELRALAAARHPSVLLSMSHGLGPPRRRPWSPAEARQHQGAMSFGSEGALTGKDVAASPFLPGGLWIYFACFGAGTPHASAYHHWLAMLAQSGMTELRPVSATLAGLDAGGGFVSGLAKAALGNPDGPLAILGHVDLAWSYSYEELRVGHAGDARHITGSNRSLNFYHLMTKLVAGERAGAAQLALRRVLGDVEAELLANYDRRQRTGDGATPEDTLALGNLWMLHQDLLGYALLGDPAVRLPLAAHDARETTARTAPTSVATSVATSAADRSSRGTPGVHGGAVDAGALDRLERAVLAMLANGESPGVVAMQLGVPRSEVTSAAEAYRDAGRAALSALLAQRAKEP
ncbi:MAG TPA: hypothetical protein VHN14_36295, partial [Kofleriaceae bacterium]|nr:hypothetical protein [Kofleriaceae bacterium]